MLDYNEIIVPSPNRKIFSSFCSSIVILELDARMLFLIFILESIKQFFITIEFWISQFDNLELSPILTFGPKIALGPIKQFLPIIHGPKFLSFQKFLNHVPL